MEAMKRNNTGASSPMNFLKCLLFVGISAVMALNSTGQGQVNWNNQETIQYYEWEHDYGSMILSDEELAALYADRQNTQMMPPYPGVPFEGIHGLFLSALLMGAFTIYRKNKAVA